MLRKIFWGDIFKAYLLFGSVLQVARRWCQTIMETSLKKQQFMLGHTIVKPDCIDIFFTSYFQPKLVYGWVCFEPKWWHLKNTSPSNLGCHSVVYFRMSIFLTLGNSSFVDIVMFCDRHYLHYPVTYDLPNIQGKTFCCYSVFCLFSLLPPSILPSWCKRRNWKV